MIIKKNKLFVCFIYLITVLASVFLIISENSFAAGSGAWIPEGSTSGTAGGGGGGSSNCSGDNGKYIVDCTGVSWIHYRYVGGASHRGQDVLFTPGSSYPLISGECAYEGRGFWHFGVNAKGFNYNGFADTTRVMGYSNATNVYLGSSGKWGHRLTYTMGFWRDYDWMQYKTYGSNYYHQLYKEIDGEYVLMYQADGYASDPETNGDSAVLRDYKVAYKRKNGSDYIGRMPDGAYAFCSWGGDSDSVTLSAVGKIYPYNTRAWTTDDLGPGASQTVNVGEDATVIVPRRLYKDGKVYEFEVWGTSCNNPDDRKCTEKKMSKDYLVAAHYKERSLPCGGLCGSTLKLELTHDGKTETSTALVNGENGNAVEKSIIGPLVEGFDVGADYHGKVYVKPGGVSIKGSFKPEYQSSKGRHPSQLSIIDYGTFKDSNRHRANAGKKNHKNSEYPAMDGWNNNPDLATTIQQYVGNYYDEDIYTDIDDSTSKGKQWNNAFNIAVKDSAETEVRCYPVQGAIGSDSEFSDTISYSFKVGHRFSMQSRTNDFRNDDETNYCTDGNITPRAIAFEYYDEIYERAIINNSRTRTARIEAYVPYNFRNTIEAEKNEEKNIVFAGEPASVKYKITSSPKENSKVGGTYLTNIPNIKVKAKYRYKINNVYSGYEDLGSERQLGSLNTPSIEGFSTNSIESNSTESFSVPVPDYNAGGEVCISVGVWPASSGADTNWNSPSGDNEWAWSNDVCYTIAKKPSFQIWGGNLYSNGNINVPIATKTFTVKNDKGEDEDIKRTFGSWVELGITSEGKVEGLASGAGTGYARTDDARKIIGSNYDSINSSTRLDYLGGIGVTATSNFCNISTLSIPNNKCKSDYVGRNNSTSVDPNDNKSDLVAMFDKTDDVDYTLEEVEGNKTIDSEETLSQYTTHVTKATGDVIITANIKYENGGYTTLQQIPKRIIYAGNNIKINCNVTRIDAVLIAEGNIDTCANGGDVNTQGRSTQLIINGTTISNKLILGRTYGAATGNNSAIPAEIINYDTSLYLWANGKGGSGGSGNIKFINVSTSELAPRY